jgi:acyl dehydratase
MKWLEAGDRLPEARYLITQEKITRYSRYALEGRDTATIHTDAGKARQAGLPGPVAHGRHLVAFFSEALLRVFGEAWLRSGELDVNLTRLVFPGDTLTLRAEVVKAAEESGGRRVVLQVALVNQRGEAVQSGEARVLASVGQARR